LSGMPRSAGSSPPRSARCPATSTTHSPPGTRCSTIATLPGEWQEAHLSSYAVVPTKWVEPTKDSLKSLAALSAWFDSTESRSLHEWIFAGGIDVTTFRRASWFSNTLVLPGFNIYEALKIDDPKKVEWKDHIFNLRGRHLEGAIFNVANLTKVELSNAHLEGAALDGTYLQGAKLDQSNLRGASLVASERVALNFRACRSSG
jgi:hypothetical protein